MGWDVCGSEPWLSARFLLTCIDPIREFSRRNRGRCAPRAQTSTAEPYWAQRERRMSTLTSGRMRFSRTISGAMNSSVPTRDTGVSQVVSIARPAAGGDATVEDATRSSFKERLSRHEWKRGGGVVRLGGRPPPKDSAGRRDQSDRL